MNLSPRISYDLLNKGISENDAVQYQPCRDENLAAYASLSTLNLLELQGQVYHIGDRIYVLATLFDSNGKRKSTGGDQLRARIFNPNLNASAPGAVLDYKNGTYLLIFDALWSGRAWIMATIAYTREMITAYYRVISEVLSLMTIHAKFEVRNYAEDTTCHPDMNHLLKCTNYKSVCNFTSLNSGMPWYCGKPQHQKIQCNDWKYLRSQRPEIHASLLSKCEKNLLDKRYIGTQFTKGLQKRIGYI